MERNRRVRDVWSWLPAFRVVAETQHLPTAANELRVSASALSRTVRLLEDELGVALFRREGRGLVLNDAGEALLRHTRDAMRLVDEGVALVCADGMRGALRVSSSGVATEPYVLPTLTRMLVEHPELVIELGVTPVERVVDDLVRGLLDLSIQSILIDDDRIQTTLLGKASNGVYCGRGHPLWGRTDVTVDELAEHPFAAPPADDMGRTWEGWPMEVPRQVQMRIGRLQLGIEAAASGVVLAVLPDVLVHGDARLCRLPLDLLAPTPILALTRRSVGVEGRAERVVEALRKQMAAPPQPP